MESVMSGIRFIGTESVIMHGNMVHPNMIDVWAVSEAQAGCLPECAPIMIRREDGVPGGLGNWDEAREVFMLELESALDVLMDECSARDILTAAERDCPHTAPTFGYSFPVGASRILTVEPMTVTEEDYLLHA